MTSEIRVGEWFKIDTNGLLICQVRSVVYDTEDKEFYCKLEGKINGLFYQMVFAEPILKLHFTKTEEPKE